MHSLENLLQALEPHNAYLQWNEGQLDDGKRTLSFFYRNVLDWVRYLLPQIAYRDDFVYTPRREYDTNGQRIYAEMHTADWWWDLQVQPHNSFLSKQSLTETRSISKNTSLRPVRPVRQTHLTDRTSIANQDAPGAHLTLRTHRAYP